MKRHLWSLWVVIPTLIIISSCQANELPLIGINAALPDAPADYGRAATATYTIEVSSAEIVTLIESEASFVVYIGNDQCTSCIDFKPAFFQYIDETGMLVYHYDNVINGSDYEVLREAYPDYFIDYDAIATPSLLFFKRGELRTRQNGTTRMFDINTLRPIMESYAQVIDLPVIHDPTTYADTKTDGVYFVYNRFDTATIAFYDEHLLSLVVDESYPLHQLEISLDEDLAEEIDGSLTLYPGTTFYHLQDGEINSTISLQTAGVEATLSWLDDIR